LTENQPDTTLPTSVARLRVFSAGLVLAVAAAMVVAASTGAGNRQSYSDPPGDSSNANGTAPDSRSLTVAAEDDGTVRIDVTLVDATGRLEDLDQVYVQLDLDRNRRTGGLGAGVEVEAMVLGSREGPPSSRTCRYSGGSETCTTFVRDPANDVSTGPNTHVVHFVVTGIGVAQFDFYVNTVRLCPSCTGFSPRDHFPVDANSRQTFQTRMDPDRDRRYGAADSCPTVRAQGIFDRNRNGCPGPFRILAPRPHTLVVPFPRYLEVRRLGVSHLPAGTRVSFRLGLLREVVAVGRSGAARSPIFGRIPYGFPFIVRATKPGFVGSYWRLVPRGSGLRLTQELCLPAVGRARPQRCTPSLRGR
jgi:hypothetical protein